jgi:putative restriction endonuclease
LRHGYAEDADILAPITEEEQLQLDGGEKLDADEVTEALPISEDELENPPTLTDEEIQEPVQVNVKPRDAKFRILVRRAYGYACAVCGSNLRSPGGQPEVQSAHIYPKEKYGKDDPRNGLCLCRRHHWAFDAGWMSLSDDYTVLVRSDLPTNEDYSFIRQYAGEKMFLPSNERFAPHPTFMHQAHRKMKGFD